MEQGLNCSDIINSCPLFALLLHIAQCSEPSIFKVESCINLSILWYHTPHSTGRPVRGGRAAAAGPRRQPAAAGVVPHLPMWIIAEQSITYYVQGFCNCSCSSSCSWTAASTTGGSSASSTSGRARCLAREGQIQIHKNTNSNTQIRKYK